jgi:DNA-binding transcriptional MerR regulator
MSASLTIGAVSRRTGLPAKTIRFYEDEGLLPRARRGQNGYRLYSESDVLRLQLVRRGKLLGLDLPAIRNLISKALSQDCAAFGDELRDVIARQRAEVESRLAELTALRDELTDLEEHITHCCDGCSTTELAADCDFCGLLEAEAGSPTATQTPRPLLNQPKGGD